MRTLLVSDLHLGAVGPRAVLRRPVALDALLAEAEAADRLVLLGDTVELLEGRTRAAVDAAVAVLHQLAEAMPGKEIAVVPGNHDHALISPWLRARFADLRPLGRAERVPRDATPLLERICDALRPARATVRYPGLRVRRDVYATHGHYLDCLMVRGIPGAPPPQAATPDDFERAPGPSAESVLRVLSHDLPPGLRQGAGAAAGTIRRTTMAALPVLQRLPGVDLLAPLNAGALGHRLGTVGVAAMADAVLRLGIRERHVIFGHIHRAGPLPADDPATWAPSGTCLHNTGSWVFDPLLLGGAEHHHQTPNPYWPGRAIVVDGDHPPQLLRLLDAAPASVLVG